MKYIICIVLPQTYRNKHIENKVAHFNSQVILGTQTETGRSNGDGHLYI